MEKETYTYEPHVWVIHPLLGKSYCVHCGLIRVQNNFTSWAVEKGCLNRIHPSHDSARSKFTKLK